MQCQAFLLIREWYPLFPDKSSYNSNGCTASSTLRNASSFQRDALLEGGTTHLQQLSGNQFLMREGRAPAIRLCQEPVEVGGDTSNRYLIKSTVLFDGPVD